MKDDFRALSGGLAGGRTIVVPSGEVFDLVANLGDTHGLGSQIEARTADPDVLGDGCVVFGSKTIESGSKLSKAGFHVVKIRVGIMNFLRIIMIKYDLARYL